MTEIKHAQPLTLIPMDAETLAQLMEQASERGARRAIEEQARDGYLTTDQAAKLMGYVRADGRPNVSAFKAFRQRTPEFRKLGAFCGRTLRFKRSDLEQFVKERTRPAGGGSCNP